LFHVQFVDIPDRIKLLIACVKLNEFEDNHVSNRWCFDGKEWKWKIL